MKRRPFWVVLIPAILGRLLGTCGSCATPDGAAGDRAIHFARAPYLQLATPDSITILWRTEAEIKPVVRYGGTPGELDGMVDPANIKTSIALPPTEAERKALQAARPELFERPALHSAPAPAFQYQARLTGLSPNTQYFYAIYDGARRLTKADPSYSFVTHPPPGEGKSARFWVVGDSGTGRATQHEVYTAMLDQLEKDRRPLDLVLHLGGMAFARGRDVEFQTRFFETYERTLRQVVCWPTLGDPEGMTSVSSNGVGPYYDAYVCPTRAEAGGVASGTEAYYSFDYGRIHFICLNSQDMDRKPTGRMATWLRLDLERAGAGADWVVAFFHHPPYTKGTHDSDREKHLIDMRTHIMPILDAGGVDLVLSGHSHIYERSMLMDQAYATPTVAPGVILDDTEGDSDRAYSKSAGLEPNGGAVFVVAGNGGTTLGRKGTMPVMRKSIVEHGSVLIDIDGDTLRGMMLNKYGEVRDTFGLLKRGQVVHRRPVNPWRAPEFKASLPESPAEPPEDFFVVIPKFATWTYLAGNHPDGTNWTEVGFEGTGWKKGEAPFGYGYKEARTILDNMQGRYSVVYIRHEFDLQQADAVADLGLMINYDDGFIAYLNGQEVARRGVGKGSGKNAAQIQSHDAARFNYFPLPGFEKHLRRGVNVLAIEGHNASMDSGDFLMDPYLLIED